ncbi:hypothetical protein [Pseudomonas guariconensis]|uniref:hypothetical protein n=1 Tax=Pseudomonas guariconensis TaxID=1288410 RepID=UPI0018A961A3|nr:hypothetical protein [Pseudomonas guariconensis]MBF8742165.1 hypothetical protein [Pseudomonas guariconensis]MBF8751287.1 hypothetical protein [Pseudomonas guariconensis]
MAIRKKVETIHLRVSATSKACLEGLANVTGKTSTRVLEELIAEAAQSCLADADVCVDDRFSGEDWTLLEAVKLAQIADEPILKKLRTYFLADRALSRKDEFIVEAILWSPDSFSGDTDIFLESEGVITNPDQYTVSKVDLDAINQLMPSLEDYAEFRLKNKFVSPSYSEYMRMLEKN